MSSLTEGTSSAMRGRLHDSAAIGVSWLTPLMVVIGAWATRVAWRQPDWVLWLALAVILAIMWSLIWSAITGIHWDGLLTHWPARHSGEPLLALPYAQPGSDAAHLAMRLGQFKHWLSREVWPHYGNTLLLCALAIIVTAGLAPVLGTTAVLLSLAALSFSQIAALACRGNGKPSTLFSGVVTAGMPALLGYTTFQEATIVAWVLSFSIVAIYAEVRRQPTGIGLGFAIPALISAGLRWPISAFALATIWAARYTLKPSSNSYSWLALAAFVLATTAG
jgi:hypothetical protein